MPSLPRSPFGRRSARARAAAAELAAQHDEPRVEVIETPGLRWINVERPRQIDLAWLQEQPEGGFTTLMGAKTYRLMSGFAAGSAGTDLEAEAVQELTAAPKVVISSTLPEPLEWANTRLVRGDARERAPGIR